MENHKETYGWANINHVGASGYCFDYLNTAAGTVVRSREALGRKSSACRHRGRFIRMERHDT